MLKSAVIVGLLPRQAKIIAKEFPGAGLKFIPKEREREASELAQGFDRVLVMTKFISHAVWNSLPREKILPINGGLSSLRRALESIPLPKPAPTLKSVPTPKPIPTPKPAPAPATKIESAPMAQGSKAIEIDFSAIKAAEVGQTIRYIRPSQLTQEKFERRVSAIRGYYKRSHGVLTSQRTSGDAVEVVVEERVSKKTAADAPLALEQTHGVQQFWSEAYLRFISANPGATDETLAARADAALAAFKERFG